MALVDIIASPQDSNDILDSVMSKWVGNTAYILASF